MALSINGEIFYKQIFPKIKYDKTIGKYRIDISDYILIKLNKRQLRVLENICKRNHIYLEKLPRLITVEETKNLFKKLKYLKEKIEINKDTKDIAKLEEEYYQIRTKIFEGNQIAIYRIIASNIPNYDKSPSKEDIIQLGYETLLHLIDIYDVDKGMTFREYLYAYALEYLTRYIGSMKEDIYSNRDLMKIIELRNKLEKEITEPITIDTLSKESKLSTQRVKELLVLEQILNANSIEKIKEYEEYDETCFIDDTKEDEIYFEVFKDFLLSIIDTLPNEYQKQVIIFYYGLNGEEPLRYNKIAEILGLSRQRVEQHRDDAMENLRNPARSKYIKELTEGYTQIEIAKESSDIPKLDVNQLLYERFEAFLVQYIPQEILIEEISQLEEKYQEILLYHFGIKCDLNIDYYEKVKLLGMSPTTFVKRKKEGLKKLRIIFEEKYIDNHTNENINTFLDYLMYNYLNKNKHIKKRSK